MDAVILAAGYGKRLKGRVPRFWKPMMLVDGIPLVVSAVERAADVDCNRIIVVVSPQNAAPMSEILPDDERIHLAVQRRASGPGDALLHGLELTHDKSTLVLMGDNISNSTDVDHVVRSSISTKDAQLLGSIGIQTVKATEENQQFTRRRLLNGHVSWVEKIPYGQGDITPYPHGMIRAWVGPLVVSSSMAYTKLSVEKTLIDKDTELPIGPYLNDLSPSPRLVPVGTLDVGTPESAQDVTAS